MIYANSMAVAEFVTLFRFWEGKRNVPPNGHTARRLGGGGGADPE